MAGSSSARRYAQAVFDIAREHGDLQQWQDDLTRLADIFSNLEVISFLENPKIAYEQKAGVLSQHLKGLRPLAQNLAQLLIQKDRVRLMPEIVEEYQRFMDGYLGVVPTQVVSAIPLTNDQEKEIGASLRLMTGKDIRLTTSVDPEILGGLVIRMGDRVLDGSTRTQLQSLRSTLLGSPN
jgi:F-type H+-transporting ATPase subunit delta